MPDQTGRCPAIDARAANFLGGNNIVVASGREHLRLRRQAGGSLGQLHRARQRRREPALAGGASSSAASTATLRAYRRRDRRHALEVRRARPHLREPGALAATDDRAAVGRRDRLRARRRRPARMQWAYDTGDSDPLVARRRRRRQHLLRRRRRAPATSSNPDGHAAATPCSSSPPIATTSTRRRRSARDAVYLGSRERRRCSASPTTTA